MKKVRRIESKVKRGWLWPFVLDQVKDGSLGFAIQSDFQLGYWDGFIEKGKELGLDITPYKDESFDTYVVYLKPETYRSDMEKVKSLKNKVLGVDLFTKVVSEITWLMWVDDFEF